MSADGDIVRDRLNRICLDSLEVPLDHVYRMAQDGSIADSEVSAWFYEIVAALARLEAAERKLIGVLGDFERANVHLARAEAQRDALAEALRRMSDTINAPVWPKNIRDAARAALTEAGLE